LPLPFGITFFSEQQSLFTGLSVLFLAGLVTYRGLLEKRRAASAVGAALLVGFACLSLLVSAERSRMLVLMGGFVGELVLPALVLLAFYFRFPDRMRWDFFRFLALPPSAAAWLLSARTWRSIASGEQQLPRGSFLLGDGNSDFERLTAQYALSPASIIELGARTAQLTTILLVVAYGVFAARALSRLRARG
jgi:hypothetical protein